LKLLSGGYIPLLIGLGVLIFMQTWEWGRKHVTNTLEKLNDDTVADLIRIKKENNTVVPRSIVLMTKQPLEKLEDTSPYMQLFISRYGVLPKHLILLNVDVIDIPHAHDNRYTITKFYEDENKGSIVAVKANYGYMEDIDVELLLKDLAKQKEINIDENPRDWLIHAVHERVLRGEFKSSLDKMRYILFIMIHRVTSHADTYFNLGRKNKLTIEILPVYIH
jgi:KUP system potassium uptake protein